jgi:GntR family transcriptional regulator / MocR family aminotransferase
MGATDVRSRPPDADFRLGRPDLSAFPRAQWVSALRAALSETPDAALGPGDPRGAVELRTALAAYLGRVRGVIADPEDIVVCSGFAQGLRLVAEALRAEGAERIGLEDPCLPDHRAIVTAAGLEIEALHVDDEGAATGTTALSAVVLTPAHQCPLGATLSARRRGEHLASEQLVVEDDYDAEFRYDRQPVGALQGRAPDRVVYAGSASKTLAPALRLGWLVLPATLRDSVIEQKRRADRGTPVLDQLALARLITTGALDRHVRRMRRRYRARRDAVVRLLDEPLGTAAGLHVVARIDDEDGVLSRADGEGVALSGLKPYWHADPRMQGIVIGYGTPPEHGFDAALQRLARVLG